MNKKNFRSEADIVADLKELTSKFSFVKILAALAYQDFCSYPGEKAYKNVHEVLAYNEFSYLIGLWLKNVNLSYTSYENEPDFLVMKTRELLDELHLSIYAYDVDNPTAEELKEFLTSSNSFRESSFYTATGGYDNQYIERIQEKYHLDKEWLLTSKNIDLESITAFYKNLKSRCQLKLVDLGERRIDNNFDILLDVFCLTEAEIVNNNSSYKALLDQLSLDVGIELNNSFNYIGDFNIFSERPLLRLPDGRIYVPHPFFASESLYESPFYWMNQDPAYRAKASKHRGEAAENIVYNQIVKVFEKDNVFKNVIIKESKNKTLTDIDIFAMFQDTGIIFQVKSKKLTSLSKKGDLESISNDFKKAVLDAHQQAETSKNAILNSSNYTFSTNGFENNIFEGKKFKCYSVIVLLDHYPGVTHQTNMLVDELSKETPVAFNIFDLDLIIRYLDTPELFVDYIIKRTTNSRYYFSQNEMGFLCYHIEEGLTKRPEFDIIYIDESWAQNIDSLSQGHFSNSSYIKVKPVSNQDKLGRNQTCFCGSGLKFKRCHGK